MAAVFVQKQGDACGLLTGATGTGKTRMGSCLPAGAPASHIPLEGTLPTRPPEVQPLKLGGEAPLCPHLLGCSLALMPGGLGIGAPGTQGLRLKGRPLPVLGKEVSAIQGTGQPWGQTPGAPTAIDDLRDQRLCPARPGAGIGSLQSRHVSGTWRS